MLKNTSKRLVKRVVRYFILIYFLFLLPLHITAHPHIFLDTRVDFKFEKDGLQGFWVEWLFDEIYTASIIMDFDTDKDNRFNTFEIEALEKGAFSNLQKYHYFTYLTINNKITTIQKVTSFWKRCL